MVERPSGGSGRRFARGRLQALIRGGSSEDAAPGPTSPPPPALPSTPPAHTPPAPGGDGAAPAASGFVTHSPDASAPAAPRPAAAEPPPAAPARPVVDTRERRRIPAEPAPPAGGRPHRGGLTARLRGGVRSLTSRLAASVRGGGGARGLTRRLVAGSASQITRIGEAAGRDAWRRVRAASLRAAEARRARRDGRAAPAAPAPVPAPHDEPGAGGVPLLAFLRALPGALLAPLAPASLLVGLGAAAIVAVAALLVEASPRLGLLGFLVAVGELAAVRLKSVRDAAHGHGVQWPDWGEGFASLVPYAAVYLVLAPAAGLALAAWGPGAWDRSDPGSLPARAGRLWAPSEGERELVRAVELAGRSAMASADATAAVIAAEREAAGVPQDAADVPPEVERRRELGQDALVMLDAIAGSPPETVPPDGRTPRQVAEDLARTWTARVRSLLDLQGLPPLVQAARVALLVGLALFPVALLAVALLRSAYAAVHVPLLLRAVLRAPVGYLVVLGVFLVQDAVLLLGLVVVEPAAHARLDASLAHVLAVAAGSVLVAWVPLSSAAVLGGFYRAYAGEIGWE